MHGSTSKYFCAAENKALQERICESEFKPGLEVDPMLKAVIFDMDGVIIDSEPQHARAALRVLNRHGANTDYDYCSSFIGSSTKVFTQDIMKRFPLSISLEDLLEEMNLEKKKILRVRRICNHRGHYRSDQKTLSCRYPSCDRIIFKSNRDREHG